MTELLVKEFLSLSCETRSLSIEIYNIELQKTVFKGIVADMPNGYNYSLVESFGVNNSTLIINI